MYVYRYRRGRGDHIDIDPVFNGDEEWWQNADVSFSFRRKLSDWCFQPPMKPSVNPQRNGVWKSTTPGAINQLKQVQNLRLYVIWMFLPCGLHHACATSQFTIPITHEEEACKTLTTTSETLAFGLERNPKAHDRRFWTPLNQFSQLTFFQTTRPRHEK